MNKSYKYLLLSLLTLVLAISSIILFEFRKGTTPSKSLKQTLTDNSKIPVDMIRASGKCAQCHANETPAILEHFSYSKHSKMGVTCYDCHRVVQGQKEIEHSGFLISERVTSLSC